MTSAAARPPLRLVPELIRGRRTAYLGILALSLGSGAASLAVPLVSARLIAALQDGSTIWLLVTALALLGVAATGAGALSSYLLARVSQDVIKRLRVRTARSALHGRLREVERLGSGDIATRMTADAAAVKAFLEVAPVQLPVSVLVLSGTVTIMALLDWVLLLITVASFALAFLVVGSVVVTVRRGHAELQTVQGRLTQAVVRAVDSLPLIKATRAEEHVLSAVEVEAEQARRVEVLLARATSLLAPTLNLAQQVALVGVLVGGSIRLLGGALSLPVLVAFLMYLLQLAAPVMSVVGGLTAIQAGEAAKARFRSLLDLPQEPAADATDDLVPVPHAPAVVMRSVDFSYDDGTPALRAADLTVPTTGVTAVVGSSGAGKSTLFKLLDRLYDADAGSIELLGHDVTTAPPGVARTMIAYLDQGFTLVDGSVRDNLLLGSARAVGDPEIWHHLEQVDMAEAVRQLPDGLDTSLGLGTDLSGGQRQRLAMARLLLDDRPVALLDEPTSQLDGLSAHRARLAMEHMASTRAVVVIAHRLSTVENADWVVVLEDGRVVSEGRHDDLAAGCLVYRSTLQWSELPEGVPA